MNSRTLAVLALGLLLVVPAVAEDGPDAATLFAKGKTLLAKGDLNDALGAFVAAAKAEPDNAEYVGQARILKQVVSLRKTVKEAVPSAKWERMVVSLHVYFLQNGLVDLAVDLDREAHGRAPSATTATLLAEGLLEAKKNEETAKLLADLKAEWQTPLIHTYRGIALARLGKADAARAVLKTVTVDEKTGPGLRYDLARLHVLLGELDKAVIQLTSCFEAVPPTQLKAVKDMAKACPDFAALAKTPAFEKVLAVKSKITESDCSGGSGCGSCPSRGSCDEGGK
jgi:tetratricopeptide (TPR) repeat protein